MPLKFTDGDVVVSGRDANTLAGLAIVGIVCVGVVTFKTGYAIGYHGLDFVLSTRDKIKAKLNK
jgi:hypothetical protein